MRRWVRSGLYTDQSWKRRGNAWCGQGWFSCPHCGKVYTAYYSNRKVEQLHAQLAELQERPAKGGLTRRQVEGIIVRFKNTKKKLDSEMERLRNEVEGKSQTSGNLQKREE